MLIIPHTEMTRWSQPWHNAILQPCYHLGTILYFETVARLSQRLYHNLVLEKWFPLWGERAHSLKLFCMYDKRLRYKKQNRMEEETEPQT